MDGLSAVGLAGNILQFIEFGVQVVGRLQEFSSNGGDLPQPFREVTNSLPFLLNSLGHIKQDLENDEVDEETKATLRPVIQDCTEQIKSLNQILKGTLPAPGDNQWRIIMKALASFWQDKKIQNIRTTINNYQGSLLLYQTRRLRPSEAALEYQRSSIPQNIGGSGAGDSSFSDDGTTMLSTDRAGEQFMAYSPVMTPTSNPSSPTEKIFESGWSIKTKSTARSSLTSPSPVVFEPKPRQSEPTTIKRHPDDLSLMLSEPAIDPLQRTIEAKIKYTPEGGSTHSVACRVELGRINKGQGNVTFIIWTVSESQSKYPHTEHPAGDSANDNIVSFVGRQVLWEQTQSVEQMQGAPESLLLARMRSPNMNPTFTGTVDYSFKSHQDLVDFRQDVFGKKLVVCIAVNQISLSKIECETEALSLWESFGVRTVVYFASATSRKHVDLEVVSPDAIAEYTKSPPGLTLRVKPNFVNQRANSISSNSSSWSFASKSKDKGYRGLKIRFGSLEDRDLFVSKIRH